MTLDVQATEESTVGLIAKTRQDIDYQLTSLGFSSSLITPVGLFHCEPSLLRGETRIDSFNEIVGISDVRNSEWKDLSAHNLECRYGAKWRSLGGTFKAGIGFRDYFGKTDNEPGGKRLSTEGIGVSIDYDSEHLDTKLSWQRGVHDYKIMHKTSYVDYDSLIDASESTTDATIKYKHLYLHTRYISGSKDNVYTTPLFPTNRFDYDHTDVALGLILSPKADGLTLIAPIFGGGSYRGSFNPLESDDLLKGIELAGRVNEIEIDLTFIRHEGEGNRPYLPATDNITEQKQRNLLTLGLSWDRWSIKIENAKSNHKANALIIDPLYAAILGGFGPYNNKRDEDKWTLSLSMPVVKEITANLSFYHTTRQDQQFNHPEHNYIERGASLQFNIGV
jgi:hypothetical protein